jgi:hypothetical protein
MSLLVKVIEPEFAIAIQRHKTTLTGWNAIARPFDFLRISCNENYGEEDNEQKFHPLKIWW